jgi:hypothetical protein
VGAADDVLAACQRHNGEVYPVKGADGGCATFVSAMFKEAGQGSVFTPSASVPTIVANFPADRVKSFALLKVSLADLIVFGTDEHIGIYAGNGLVWNTNGAGGTNKVQLQDVLTIRTISGKSASKDLETRFTNITDPMDPGKAATDAAGALFGTMFAWVPGFAVAAFVVVLAAVLALEGGRMMLESAEGG